MENCYFGIRNGGCGDFIMFFFMGIHLSKKNIYDKIFLLIETVHSYNLYCTYFKKFKIPDNLFILSTFDNEISYLKYKYYFDKFEKFDQTKNEIQKIDNNYYFTFSPYQFRILDTFSYFTKIFSIHNINFNNLYNIELNLNNEDYNLNYQYYNTVINKIGKNYICIFDDPLRLNSIFSFKYYKKIFNKNNYPVIYFNEQYNCILYNDKNYYTISNILGENKLLYHYHDIVCNSKEVHFTNSFNVCYFKFIFSILKEKFKNVIKYIYPRLTFGINHNLNNINIDINKIDTLELLDFENFKIICPINFFSLNNSFYEITNYKTQIYNDFFIPQSGQLIKYNNNIFFEKANNFINVIKKDNYYFNINYFNKFIINANVLNILGIVDYNDMIKIINVIIIDLNNNNIKLYGSDQYTNVILLDETENNINNILNIYLKNKDKYLNFVFLKSDIPFYLIINERELDNDYNIISNNDIINNYNQKYINFLNILMENRDIGYIFPYVNDSEFDLWSWYHYNLTITD